MKVTAIGVVLVLLGVLLGTGCMDEVTGFGEESWTGAASYDAYDGPRVRHTHLMDQAVRRDRAGKATSTVGLIIAMDKAKVGANGIVSRFRLLSRYGLVSRYEYDNVFFGLAVEIDASRLEGVLAEMAQDDSVAWVEPDIFTQIDLPAFDPETGSGQLIPWGMERIGATQSSAVSGDGQGTVAGVEVYVLDTGVRPTDLTVVEEVSFAGTSTAGDEEGHGTHIAATIAAKDDANWVVGVAPGANVHSIKVLGDNGEAEISNVVAGIEHVVNEKLQNPGTPVVLNLSLGADIGTTQYNALDVAVDAAVATGITVVVSAGNDGIDAATITPAHAAGAITVGAYDVFNQFAAFSNHGSSVDLLAPGVDVLSLALGSSGQVELALSDGTSMAAPHVAGAAALFLSENPNATPAQVKAALLSSAKPMIWGVPDGTTSKAVYVGAFDELQVPPFFDFAVMSDGDMELKGDLYVGLETGETRNANLFTNDELDVESSDNLVEGFGYYASKIKGSGAMLASIFQPLLNPKNLPGYLKVEEIDVPFLQIDRSDATRVTDDDLDLAGHYTLGTREDPLIWYVDGDLETDGPVSFSGYGVFVVTGNIKVKHDMVTQEAVGETTLGLYTESKLEFEADNVALAAQLFANGDVKLKGNATLYGSITAQGKVVYDGAATIYHRPASPALTEPFWPSGGHGVSEPPITTSTDVPSGWTLVGLPLNADDPDYRTLYPNALEGTLFTFDGTFAAAENLEWGEAYWLRFPSASTVDLTGYDRQKVVAELAEGWNLVSGPNCTVNFSEISDPDNLIIDGTLYGFDEVYFSTDRLEPSQGYWLRARAPGSVDLLCPGRPAAPLARMVGGLKQRARSLETTPRALGLGRLLVQDAAGAGRVLHFGRGVAAQQQDRYSLPPVPPAGAFDVRFEGDTRLAGDASRAILWQGTEGPMRIEVEAAPATGRYVLEVTRPGRRAKRHVLRAGLALDVDAAATVRLLTMQHEE